MVRSEQVRTLFYSTESQEAKSEVLSISAICPRACHSGSSDFLIDCSSQPSAGKNCSRKVITASRQNWTIFLRSDPAQPASKSIEFSGSSLRLQQGSACQCLSWESNWYKSTRNHLSFLSSSREIDYFSVVSQQQKQSDFQQSDLFLNFILQIKILFEKQSHQTWGRMNESKITWTDKKQFLF